MNRYKHALSFGATLRMFHASQDYLDYQLSKMLDYSGNGDGVKLAENTVREWAFLLNTHPDRPIGQSDLFRAMCPRFVQWESRLGLLQGQEPFDGKDNQ